MLPVAASSLSEISVTRPALDTNSGIMLGLVCRSGSYFPQHISPYHTSFCEKKFNFTNSLPFFPVLVCFDKQRGRLTEFFPSQALPTNQKLIFSPFFSLFSLQDIEAKRC